MSIPPGELIPSGDPRFERAQFISESAIVEYKLQQATWLRGARWRWATWKGRPAVFIDGKTGTETATVWDHDHCEICNQGFSERYDHDLREGWTTPGPAGLPEADWKPDYHWLCPHCFEQYHDRLAWSVRD